MAKGDSDQIKFELAPLMTEYQRETLDNMLRGYVNMMQGFQLGTPFPGYNVSSFTPSAFQMGQGTPTPWRPYAGERDKDEEEEERRRRENGDRATGQASTSVLANILGTQLGTQPATTQQSGLYSSYLPNFFTGPYVQPYAYGLTGNYPKTRRL